MIQLSSEKFIISLLRGKCQWNFLEKGFSPSERRNFYDIKFILRYQFPNARVRLRASAWCVANAIHWNIMHTVPMMIPQKPHTDSPRLVTQKPITALETFKWNSSAEIKMENDISSSKQHKFAASRAMWSISHSHNSSSINKSESIVNGVRFKQCLLNKYET